MTLEHAFKPVDMTDKGGLKKLMKIYGDDRLEPDLFGRRDATPAEVQRALEPKFEDLINQYPPTREDIERKDE